KSAMRARNEAKDEIGRALELDPTNVEALAMDAWARPADRIDRARRAAEAHPHGARAFAVLGELERRSRNTRPSWRRSRWQVELGQMRGHSAGGSRCTRLARREAALQDKTDE